MPESRKSLERLPPLQQKAAHQRKPAPAQRVPQVAYAPARVDPNSLTPADLLTLQRTFGNRFVQNRLQRQGTPSGWSDPDKRTYPAPTGAGQLPTPAGGWNAATQTIGSVERIPLEGLKEGLQPTSPRSPTEVKDEKAGVTKESENGKAIAIVPTTLKPGQPVEIFLHLHGHNLGYRERSQPDTGPGMATGTVRDVAADRIEQQIESSGRNMIGILPQGTTMSGFGAFNPQAYIDEVWGRLSTMNKLPTGATRGSVVLSGHSGAGAPITKMLASGNLPTGLGELVLFDAINDGVQLQAVEVFLQKQMAADLKKLKDLADPTLNGGLDPGAVTTQQTAYLAGSFRFRGIFTPKYLGPKLDKAKQPVLDPQTNKPVMEEKGYGVQYEPLQHFLKQWMDTNTKGLDASVAAALRDNYKVTPAGTWAHNTILSANDNLKTALGALPAAPAASTTPTTAPTTAPPTPSTPNTAPPTGGLQNAPTGSATTQIAPALIQREPAPPAAQLTDEQQWEQDWNTHTAQQSLFAGSDRPAGTPRHRYDILCPLYKAHGILRPMIYMASSITTAKFYHFSTPAHSALATALATAEATLRGKGYDQAPVTSVWALNARTTSTGAWSNHADGKAVDLDPDSNPHLIEKKERKMISLVTGSDLEAGGQGYDVMKGLSDKFKSDYNAAGLERRLAELKAAETAKQTERDTAKSERDTLKGQRDSLKSERDDLKRQLKAVPHGKQATADDAAKATALQASIQQREADIKQVEQAIKQKESEIKTKEAELKEATKDRELLEKELTKFQATEKAISDLETAVKSLPDEIKAIDDQIAQASQDEQDAKAANNASGAQAARKLRSTLERASTQKKAELKNKQTQLDKKKKDRDAEPLRKYAAGGFLNLSKDVVEAMTGAGLKWGGNWTGAKDFMHFEL